MSDSFQNRVILNYREDGNVSLGTWTSSATPGLVRIGMQKLELPITVIESACSPETAIKFANMIIDCALKAQQNANDKLIECAAKAQQNANEVIPQSQI